MCEHGVYLPERWQLALSITALPSPGAEACFVRPHPSALGLNCSKRKRREVGKGKGEEKEEEGKLYVIFNNKKPLTLTLLNKC